MFNTKHIARAALLTVASGTLLTASLVGAGQAQAGIVSVESCTGLNGSISWNPGLVKTKVQTEHAVLTGTLSGCSGLNGAQAGTGTVTAVLTGQSKVGSIVETGTVTVNWPAASGLNPSNGTLTIRRPAVDQPISVSGSITSGAFTGASLASSLLVSGHTGSGTAANPIVHQDFVNTAPFAARRNLG